MGVLDLALLVGNAGVRRLPMFPEDRRLLGVNGAGGAG